MTVVELLRAGEAHHRAADWAAASEAFRLVLLHEPTNLSALTAIVDGLTRVNRLSEIDRFLEDGDRLAVQRASELHFANAVFRHDVAAAVRRATVHLQRFAAFTHAPAHRKLHELFDKCRLSAETTRRIAGSPVAFYYRHGLDDAAVAPPPVVPDPPCAVADWLGRVDALKRAGDINGACDLFLRNYDWTSPDERIPDVCQRLFSMTGIYNHYIYSHLGMAPFLNGARSLSATESYIGALYRVRRTAEIVERLADFTPSYRMEMYLALARADCGDLPGPAKPADFAAIYEAQPGGEDYGVLLRTRAERRAATIPTRRRDPAELRVAVCFSGQLRGYRQTLPVTLEALRRVGPVDVFLSTWDNVGRVSTDRKDIYRLFDKRTVAYVLSESNDPAGYVETVLPGLAGSVMEASPVDELAAEFDATGLTVESEAAFDARLDAEFPDLAPRLRNQYKMFYKINAGHALMLDHVARSGALYDYVLRIRPDVHVYGLDMAEVGRRLGPWSVGTSYLLEEGFGDQFAVGGVAAMTRYAGTWDRIAAAGHADYLPTTRGVMAERLLLHDLFAQGVDPVVLREARVGKLESLRIGDRDLLRRLAAIADMRALNDAQKALARFVLGDKPRAGATTQSLQRALA